jgi:hypothetical protein
MIEAIAAATRTRRTRMRGFVALSAAVIVALSTGLSSAAQAPSAVPNAPYTLPVTLPGLESSPAVDAAAPYTPVVLSLIAQLEGSNPTQAQLANADLLLHETQANTASGWKARPTPFNPNNVSCHNVGPVLAPATTTPSISDICWTDAQGVLTPRVRRRVDRPRR